MKFSARSAAPQAVRQRHPIVVLASGGGSPKPERCIGRGARHPGCLLTIWFIPPHPGTLRLYPQRGVWKPRLRPAEPGIPTHPPKTRFPIPPSAAFANRVIDRKLSTRCSRTQRFFTTIHRRVPSGHRIPESWRRISTRCGKKFAGCKLPSKSSGSSPSESPAGEPANSQDAEDVMELTSTIEIESMRAAIVRRRARPGKIDHKRRMPSLDEYQAPSGKTKRIVCTCGTCRVCQDNERWERIFQSKFADPLYYVARPPAHHSPLGSN